MCDLPDLAVDRIVQCLADSSVFQLMTLASVSRLFRSLVKDLDVPCLKLESSVNLTDPPTWPRDAISLQFRRQSLERKRQFYESAASLIRRHKAICCKGEAISDKVVMQLANDTVETVCLEDCCNVTDHSLALLLTRCPNLKELHLKNLASVAGLFLPQLLLQAKQLQHLTLKSLSGARWNVTPETTGALTTLPGLRSMTLEAVVFDHGAHSFFRSFPRLSYLSVDCSPALVWAAANYCPELQEVVLSLDTSHDTDDCLAALLSAPSLKTLELSPKSFTLTSGQLRLAGVLNLTELRLDSHYFKQQPLNRIGMSHIDNDGVKVLVDTICARRLYQGGRQPFKLSLAGASSITHDAVSAMLRLPLLSGLVLDGCHRISSIDKMRLIAKVKAGRELLEGDSWSKKRQDRLGLHIPSLP